MTRTLVAAAEPNTPTTVPDALTAAADLIAAGQFQGGTGTQLGLGAIRWALFRSTRPTVREQTGPLYVGSRSALARQLLPAEAPAADVVDALRAAAEQVAKDIRAALTPRRR